MPQNTRRYFEESEQLLEGRKPEGPEFAALMRSKVGDRFKYLVTPENLGLMSLVGDPKSEWNVAGMNFPKGLEGPEGKAQMQEKLSPILAEANQELPEGKRIFGVGSHADAGTYAHELRHEAISGERFNRVMDLVHGSTSLPAYKANLDRLFKHIVKYDKDAIENTSYDDKEKIVFDAVSYQLGNEASNNANDLKTTLAQLLKGNSFYKNVELNKAGAVGGFLDGKKLPDSVVRYRAKMPFLNFVGRLGEYDSPTKSTKKASGGMIENTTHYRKIL